MYLSTFAACVSATETVPSHDLSYLLWKTLPFSLLRFLGFGTPWDTTV